MTARRNVVGDIIRYEAGELDVEAELDLFAYLIRTGIAWSLQGHYGRTAAALIDEGLIEDGHVTELARDRLAALAEDEALQGIEP